MHHIAWSLIGMTIFASGMSIATSPVAGAYANCSEAIAAGAAPIYAGQAGYSKKLDRDGDGVACETGGGGSSYGGAVMPPPSAYTPSPFVGVPWGSAPVAPPAAPASPPTGYGVVTVVDWIGTNCIDITAPDPNSAGVLRAGNYCGGAAQFVINPQSGDQMVGADPVIGSASSASCEILSGRLIDSGVAGDGHDINCLTRAAIVR